MHSCRQTIMSHFHEYVFISTLHFGKSGIKKTSSLYWPAVRECSKADTTTTQRESRETSGIENNTSKRWKTCLSSLCFFGLREKVLELWNLSQRVRKVGPTHTHAEVCFRCFRHTWLKDHSTVVFHHIASSHNITMPGNVRLHCETNSNSSPAWESYVCSRGKI